MVSQLGDGAAHHIDHGKASGSPPLTLFHSGNSIRSFPRLGQHDEQRMFVNLGITVAKLTGQLYNDRNATELFNGIFPGYSGIIGRTASGDNDFLNFAQFFPGKIKIIQMDHSVPKSGRNRCFNGSGLFHDLFEHKVLIAAFFSSLNAPGDPADFFVNGGAGTVEHNDAVCGQLRKLSVLQIDRVPGMGHQSGNIGGKVIFPYADA